MYVQCLSGEDPWEEEMATHSSILAWRISWTEEPSGLQSMGLQKTKVQLSMNVQALPTVSVAFSFIDSFPKLL